MNIINTSQINFTTFSEYLITKVVYDFNDKLTLNPWKTYGKVLIDPIVLDNNTFFYLHNLNEPLIRACRLMLNDTEYKAVNGQSFWEFVKEHFRLNKSPPQTIAQFKLPQVTPGDTVEWRLERDFSLTFESLPWEVKLKHEYRETVLSPSLQNIHVHRSDKTLTTLLIYKAKEGADIIIEGGDNLASLVVTKESSKK